MIEPGLHRISMKAIVAGVCAYHEIRRADLLSQRRTREIVRPRQLAMYLGQQLTPLSLPAIGRLLGGRDHTTVLHGTRVISRLIETDPQWRVTAETIAVNLGAVVGAGVLDPTLAVDRDPLEVALAIAEHGSEAIALSAEGTREMAMCLVGYARRLGALRFDDEDEPDPEQMPLEVEVEAPPTSRAEVISAAIDATRRAYDEFATARYSAAERKSMDLLSKALLRLFEAQSNTQKG